MKTFIYAIALALAFGFNAQAQVVSGNASYTNSMVVSKGYCRLYSLTGYNSNAGTQYIQIIATNGVPANGTVPTFSIPVAGSQYYSIDFRDYGADFDSLTVCNSSTANTLTIGASDTSFQAIVKK